MDRDAETEAFKRLNLTEIAAANGYEIDRKESSRNSAVMRGPNDDKIIIRCDPDAHWVYFSVRDRDDNGTVIDFLKHRSGAPLARVFENLRIWAGDGPPSRPDPSRYVRSLEPTMNDIPGIRAEFLAMATLENGQHRFLNEERYLAPSLLAHPRLVQRVRVDPNGNAVFPHSDQEGITGFERVNHGFRGFAPGGKKGLWFAGMHRSDSQLVVAESAIDAISYAAIHGFESTRLVSLAGQVSPKQVDLVGAAIEKLALKISKGGEVVFAFDNDQAGDDLAEKFTRVFEDAAHGTLTSRPHLPETGDFDWNDELRGLVNAGDAGIFERFPEWG